MDWSTPAKAKQVLDKAGSEGWELVGVSVVPQPPGLGPAVAFATFKRPAP